MPFFRNYDIFVLCIPAYTCHNILTLYTYIILAKFEEETKGNMKLLEPSRTQRFDGSQPTQAVVSIVVAIRGQSQAVMSRVRSNNDVVSVLEKLAADALTDEGDNVMALEVCICVSVYVHIMCTRLYVRISMSRVYVFSILYLLLLLRQYITCIHHTINTAYTD